MKIEEALTRLIEIINNRKTDKLANYQSADNLKKQLHLEKDASGDWDSVFEWLSDYAHYTPNTQNPYFLNRMWSKSNLTSVLSEILSAYVNTSACSFESSPVSVLMEKYMFEELLRHVGFSKGEAQMTTGSSNANMIALMLARNEKIKNTKQNGLFSSSKKAFVFSSEDSHYSIDKAVNILGIGSKQLISISVDKKGGMCTKSLEKQLKIVTNNGDIALFVNATAGTTVRGAFDDLEAILKLKEKYSFWLHVDGAWGGAVILNKKLKKKYLTGLEYVDSFTWDFHKMLGSGLMCNFLLINNHEEYKNYLLKNCAVGNMSYIYHNENEHDLGFSSLQCARRNDGLKAFLDWKFYGQAALSKRVECVLNLAKYAQSIIEKSKHLEMVTPRVSFNVCFRFLPKQKTKDEAINAFNLQLRNKLFKNNEALLSYAYINKKFVFRLLFTNVDTQESHVDHLLKTLEENALNLLNTI